jgi:ABC-type multidrug transport system fused ATPase/permease subunit
MNYIIEPISELPSLIANKRAAIELIDKFIGIIKTNKINDGIYNINSIKDGITFNNVTFGFSDNVVLKNINIKFERGKSYAIIGESGSGKSTLLNLLLGSNDTYQGQILFDNIELRTIKRNCLYTIISIIQQNVFIFNSSIINNITMFKKIENINIDHAILHAGLIDVIKEKGNDYCCGENGINLSGGEKQRISIARSLIRKTSILLMDEATSALDIETSKNIENAILNIDGLTRIVVTHRLDKDILKLYDIIMVMQDGQIKEVGSFNELIQKQLFFYNMLNMSDNNTNYSI